MRQITGVLCQECELALSVPRERGLDAQPKDSMEEEDNAILRRIMIMVFFAYALGVGLGVMIGAMLWYW